MKPFDMYFPVRLLVGAGRKAELRAVECEIRQKGICRV